MNARAARKDGDKSEYGDDSVHGDDLVWSQTSVREVPSDSHADDQSQKHNDPHDDWPTRILELEANELDLAAGVRRATQTPQAADRRRRVLLRTRLHAIMQ